MNQYRLKQEINWDQVRDIINNDASYKLIYIDDLPSEDRLSKLKIALSVVYEYKYASTNLLMRRLRIGETYALMLMDFMWDQSIIEKEGEEPIYLGF